MKYKINYNYGSNPHSEIVKRDERFNKKITFKGDGSDQRINRRPQGNILARIHKAFALGFCSVVLVSLTYMCYTNSKTEAISTPKAETPAQQDEEPASKPLNGATSFQSADMPAYTDLYDQYFGNKADEARKVAKCESGMRPDAININKNGSKDIGLFQINDRTWLEVYQVTESQLKDEEVNIKTAKAIYARSNSWQAWKSSFKCHHLN